MKKNPTPPLTEKAARALAKQIVKDGGKDNKVRVKFGQTNGQIVLHVYVPGKNNMARNVTTAAEWEDHPANSRARRNDQMAKDEATERLMSSNSPARDVG